MELDNFPISRDVARFFRAQDRCVWRTCVWRTRGQCDLVARLCLGARGVAILHENIVRVKRWSDRLSIETTGNVTFRYFSPSRESFPFMSASATPEKRAKRACREVWSSLAFSERSSFLVSSHDHFTYFKHVRWDPQLLQSQRKSRTESRLYDERFPSPSRFSNLIRRLPETISFPRLYQMSRQALQLLRPQ